MPSLRRDATTGEWVVIAPGRGARPNDVSDPSSAPPSDERECPFCPGNEHMTPPEMTRVPAGPEWRLRVVPNRFPAFTPSDRADAHGPPMLLEKEATGSHEVIIESPNHDARLDDMRREEVSELVLLWRERYNQLIAQPLTEAVAIFKNFGRGAGTSLTHAHSQIAALPVLPPELLRRLAVAERHYDETGRCLYGDVLEAETAEGTRMVAERGAFSAFVPFAGRAPFETWILPARQRSSFGEIEDGEASDLAWLLSAVLGSLRGAAGDPDFNLVLASAPGAYRSVPFFRWHIRVVPRHTLIGGLELASGVYVNSSAPEEAAAWLREAIAPRRGDDAVGARSPSG